MSGPFAPELLIEEDGPVRIVTLNRPEFLNATNDALHQALINVWKYLAADREARVVVLTGAGDAFSAGGDFNHFVELWDDRHQRRREIDGAGQLVTEMLAFPLPIVAAINGPAVGLGCSLAACCDLVLIEEDAYIYDPHVSVGLTAADGGAPLWPLLMGMMRVKELLLTGQRIDASTAVEIGLATRVVAPESSVEEAVAVARKIAKLPPQAVQSTKRALNMHMEKAVHGVMHYALAEEYASFDTPEHQSLVKTFLSRSASR